MSGRIKEWCFFLFLNEPGTTVLEWFDWKGRWSAVTPLSSFAVQIVDGGAMAGTFELGLEILM